MFRLQPTWPPKSPMPSPTTDSRPPNTNRQSTTTHPLLPTITFSNQTQSRPPPQISHAPTQPTKPDRFGLQPASNIHLTELTRTKIEYNNSKRFRKPVPTKYKQLHTTTTLQFHDTMFQTTTTIEQSKSPSPPPPTQNAHDAAIQTTIQHAIQYSPPASPIRQTDHDWEHICIICS